VPLGEAVVHVLAVALHGHVDDGGDAAPRRGAEPVSNVSLANGAAERQLHVRVHVDAAGDDVLAGGVDDRSSAPSSAVKWPGAPSATIVSPSISTSCGDDAGGRDDECRS
jgi:hypothetical protein